MSETKRGLNTSNVDGMDDHDSLTINDPGPSAKRSKQEEEATEETHEVKEEEEIIKPPTSDWLDIPEWKEGQGCPLLELPREILDNIFCVRPELSGRDYVALAGTCIFFRHHMDENFFKGVLLAAQGFRISSQNSVEPFNRFILNWREDQPRAELCGVEHSQWVDNNKEECGSYPRPYTHGHYVPPGPRSSWTDAQYTVYKEEKASWQLDRRRTRLAGLEAMLEEPRKVRCRWLIDSGGCRADYHDDEDGDCTCTCQDSDLGRDADANRDPEISLYSSSVTNISDDTPGPIPAPEEPLNMDSNDEEDEFEWLRARGINSVYNHWPSESRKKVARSITRACVDIETAKSRFRLDDHELSTIRSTNMTYVYRSKPQTTVWLLAALEAGAFKLHGGPDAHHAYVAAMEAKEASKKMKEEEKDRKEKSKKERKRRRSAEDLEAAAAATGSQDASASV